MHSSQQNPGIQAGTIEHHGQLHLPVSQSVFRYAIAFPMITTVADSLR